MKNTMFVLTCLDDEDANEDYVVAVSESRDILEKYVEFMGQDPDNYIIEEVEVI